MIPSISVVSSPGESHVTHQTTWHESTGGGSDEHKASSQHCAPKGGKRYLDRVQAKGSCLLVAV